MVHKCNNCDLYPPTMALRLRAEELDISRQDYRSVLQMQVISLLCFFPQDCLPALEETQNR